MIAHSFVQPSACWLSWFRSRPWCSFSKTIVSTKTTTEASHDYVRTQILLPALSSGLRLMCSLQTDWTSSCTHFSLLKITMMARLIQWTSFEASSLTFHESGTIMLNVARTIVLIKMTPTNWRDVRHFIVDFPVKDAIKPPAQQLRDFVSTPFPVTLYSCMASPVWCWQHPPLIALLGRDWIYHEP